jgi:hypothetical protein
MKITTLGDLHIRFYSNITTQNRLEPKNRFRARGIAETMRINSKKGKKCVQGWREIAPSRRLDAIYGAIDFWEMGLKIRNKGVFWQKSAFCKNCRNQNLVILTLS